MSSYPEASQRPAKFMFSQRCAGDTNACSITGKQKEAETVVPEKRNVRLSNPAAWRKIMPSAKSARCRAVSMVTIAPPCRIIMIFRSLMPVEGGGILGSGSCAPTKSLSLAARAPSTGGPLPVSGYSCSTS